MRTKQCGSVVLTVLVLLLGAKNGLCERLAGELGASSRWGSGWLDLSRPMSFQKGDQLKLIVGGTAERILVRLLPRGQEPDQPVGIIGVFNVVASNTGTRIVKLTLDSDYPNIIQISVHGGSNPWGRYPLGAQNGNATILKADYTKQKTNEQSKPSRYQRILGQIGGSSRWGSGWLDLSRPMSFQKGDRLKLTVGGTAERILVRLLPRGQKPDQPVGIIGVFNVVASDTGTKTVELTLDSDYPNIVQISVHGGANPWGLYPLGAQNGNATILGADYAKREPKSQLMPTRYQRILGQIGDSPKWGSGWLDLSRPMSFQRDDRLKLTVGGTAQKILVRLLPRGQDPNEPAGIIGVFNVVASDTGTKTVELTLDSDYPNIVQISVHGGPNPHGQSLGAQNGGATLLKAEYAR